MPQFHVTYEIITPQSAAHADAAERGFILPGDWREPTDGVIGESAAQVKEACAMPLREAISLLGCLDSAQSGPDWRECDGRTNYRTGAVELRALHAPDSVTGASLGRITRYLYARR